MDLKTQINDSLKDAMKTGDEVRKRTLRMVMAAIKQIEVDKRISVDDAGVLSILQKELKNRRESLEEAQKAGRADLVAESDAEIAVINAFLPKSLGADELKAIVKAAIVETGAAGPADMGKVMKALMPKVAGRAPGDQVSAVVRELLAQ
jgi:uncharacterized protein YqeY